MGSFRGSSHAIKLRGQTSSSEDLDKTVRGFEISLDNCFTSALPICENHLLYSKSFTGIIWPLQNCEDLQCGFECPWERSLANSFLGWKKPLTTGFFVGVQFDGTNYGSIHSTISPFWIQYHVHQFWLNDFVGRRQMANHDIRRLKYLKIISEWIETIYIAWTWTVLWTSGKWLPISFCKHDFKAMMVLLKWFVGRGQVRDQNDLRWWQV